MVAKKNRPGYFEDKYGRWQKDRREGEDRRLGEAAEDASAERRRVYRRRADRERLEHDHRVMIEEALDDFAAEHGGHL